ncbi:YbaN family protein [Eggerthellaceae bacterium 3-80]|nr:DUF454 domain-containing protein [bacterium D16-34]
MRIIYALLGLFFFGLGALGALLPVLPTTPFLLLASFFFLRSSKRLNDWFMQTKLYKRYLANFVENREMTLRSKFLCCSPGVIIMSVLAIMIPYIWAKVLLILLVIFELWYFKTRIKTIPADIAKAQGEARLRQNETAL